MSLFPETMPRVKVENNEAKSSPAACNEPPLRARYGTVFAAASLKPRVEFGGIGVKSNINIFMRNIGEKIDDATSTPITRLLLEWEAATMPGLFPPMKGELSVGPLLTIPRGPFRLWSFPVQSP